MPFKFALIVFCAAAASAQQLTVTSAPDHSLTLTGAEFAKLPRTMITATVHGHERKFEGVLLRDVLTKAGAPLGDHLRGANTAAFVYFTAHDGYHAVLALAEIEPLFQENQILIADMSNGAALGPDDGPFQLIVPEDKKPARWVRMVEKIEVRIPQP